jgi:hypothetical protein
MTLIVLFAATIALSLVGCGESFESKRKKITNGMSEADVEAVMGGKGEKGTLGVSRPVRRNAQGQDVDVETGLVWRNWSSGNERFAVGFKDGKVAATAREP